MADRVNAFRFIEAFLRSIGDDRFQQIHRAPPSDLVYAVPLHVITPFGGADRIVTVDDVRFDHDTFAATEDSAEDIAEHARTLFRTRLPQWIWQGATASRVRTMSRPCLIPWDVGSGSNGTQLPSNVYRATAAYELRIHQYAGIS